MGGMSQRATAKVLGVHKRTIERDVTHNVSKSDTQSVTGSAATKAHRHGLCRRWQGLGGLGWVGPRQGFLKLDTRQASENQIGLDGGFGRAQPPRPAAQIICTAARATACCSCAGVSAAGVSATANAALMASAAARLGRTCSVLR